MGIRDLLAEAERAADAGDLVSAEELLRAAAELQRTELGPLHPDLANTLNNLAIIAEKTGRLRDAESFYRRAVEIASASLPADDSMVTASRQNLDDFCHAHGLPLEKPAVIEPARSEAPILPAPTAAPQSPAVSGKASRAPAAMAIGVVAAVIAALMIGRPRSPRPEWATAPAAEPTPAPAAEPARAAPDALASIDRTPSPAPTVGRAPAPVPIALATVELCQTFSRRDWQCVPAGDSVASGTIVLYTRIRSPREGIIVHRWYRGEALRKSTRLRIDSNAAEGYRTYSGQKVDPGEWRVEVRSAGGDLLHEQRFAVR
jgi:Tetratricopeptide repeat/Protein of unknown function (DUF2914)